MYKIVVELSSDIDAVKVKRNILIPFRVFVGDIMYGKLYKKTRNGCEYFVQYTNVYPDWRYKIDMIDAILNYYNDEISRSYSAINCLKGTEEYLCNTGYNKQKTKNLNGLKIVSRIDN